MEIVKDKDAKDKDAKETEVVITEKVTTHSGPSVKDVVAMILCVAAGSALGNIIAYAAVKARK